MYRGKSLPHEETREKSWLRPNIYYQKYEGRMLCILVFVSSILNMYNLSRMFINMLFLDNEALCKYYAEYM